MRLRTALATAVATLAFAAPAQADDNSVFAAYTGHADERTAANKAYLAAAEELADGRATKDEFSAVMDANDQIDGIILIVFEEVAAQEPSTAAGAKAKRLGLKEFNLLVTTNEIENNALNAYRAGNRKSGARWLRRHTRALKVYRRAYTRAHRAFKAAGFDPPPAYGSSD